MNIPNQLTILRVLMVPAFIACLLYIPNPIVCGFVTAGVFLLTSLTDMLDGKIARKYNLVTNFGKFMDPLADKFMVFAALITITVKLFLSAEACGATTNDKVLAHVMLWTTMIVVLRELGVTSIRMVCSGTGAGVIAASFFGKAKTVTQVIAIVVVLVEFALNKGFNLPTFWIASYVMIGAMAFMTVASGIDYLKSYWKYINPNN
jgi:CDP-diacylglycerol--glycerol-3-phosphate 3-phosphatidyltransferase